MDTYNISNIGSIKTVWSFVAMDLNQWGQRQSAMYLKDLRIVSTQYSWAPDFLFFSKKKENLVLRPGTK